MDKKYTIKDIAELAGVSKGTVDRVLHKRGKVSDKARLSIEQVLKEIDYQPNPIARNLKRNKVYSISVLMPDPVIDVYWLPAVQGLEKAIKEFKPFGLVVNKYYYDPNSRTSFLEKSAEAMAISIDALLLVPLFENEAREIYSKCQEKNVLIASFNNRVDSSNSGNFIGQDLYQSGRVAASLIEKLVDKNALMSVLHINEEANMKRKEKGFISYFEEKENQNEIKAHSLETENEENFKREASELLKSNPDISALFITNSKAHHFIKATGSYCDDIIIVGYDLLEENITLLKNGHIDFLIHQKPKRQAYLGIGYLAEYFLFGKPIPQKNLLPIDIITSENVSYYLEKL